MCSWIVLFLTGRLELPVIEYSSTVQVVLKYTLGTGKCIIPRTTSEAHLKDMLPDALQPIHFTTDELMLLQSLDGQLQRARSDGSLAPRL